MKFEDVLKVLLLLMPKKFLDQFFSFGDVNNAPRLLVKLQSSHIII
jgi:hypothetical protein